MKIIQCAQRGKEWKNARKGKPTASRFSEIITPKNGELSKSCDKYIYDLIAQTYVPDWEPFKGNYWTRRGDELEAEAIAQARLRFQVETGAKLEQVGFILHDNGVLGCSPDSLIMVNSEPVGGLEIKCPAPDTHVQWVLSGGLPDEHKAQVHGSMIVTGLPVWHFFSYFPGMQPHHVIVRRDEYTKKMERALMEFCKLYQAAYTETRGKLEIGQPVP